MRLRLRTLMIGVVGAALLTGAALYAWDLLLGKRDTAGLILVMEGFAGLFLVAVPFAAWHTIGLARADDAHASRIRREEAPGHPAGHHPRRG